MGNSYKIQDHNRCSVNNIMFKVTNKNIRTTSEIYSKSTKNSQTDVNNVVLTPLSLILGRFHISLKLFFYDNRFVVICLLFKYCRLWNKKKPYFCDVMLFTKIVYTTELITFKGNKNNTVGKYLLKVIKISRGVPEKNCTSKFCKFRRKTLVSKFLL